MVRGLQAEHGVDLALDRVGDRRDGDIRRVAGQATPTPRAAEALDEAGPRQRAELLLEEPKRNLLPLRDLPRGRERFVTAVLGELDHGPDRVLELLRDLQHAGEPPPADQARSARSRT